jgi:hypothetical protein
MIPKQLQEAIEKHILNKVENNKNVAEFESDILSEGARLALEYIEQYCRKAYELGIEFRDSAEVEYPVIDGHISANEYALKGFDIRDCLDIEYMGEQWVSVEQAVIENLKQLTKTYDADTPYIVKGETSYSINQVIEEIKNHTEFGMNTVNGVIKLTIDLLIRGKQTLPQPPKQQSDEK